MTSDPVVNGKNWIRANKRGGAVTHRPHTCGAHLEFMRGWLVYLSISIYLSIQSRGCSLDNHKYIRSGSIPSGVTRGRVLYNIGRPIIAQTHLTSGAVNVKNKY